LLEVLRLVIFTQMKPAEARQWILMSPIFGEWDHPLRLVRVII